MKKAIENVSDTSSNQDLHHQLYIFFNDLIRKINPRDYFWDYQLGSPIPYLVFDNFLPKHLFDIIAREPDKIPEYLWNEFTRNGSCMKECKSLVDAPLLHTLANCFNSGVFVDWLERLTDYKKLVPDPHLIGAGVSKTYKDASLKLHTDFNWNDELALNRAVSLILYISPTWKEEWKGDLEFWDFDRKKIVQSISPVPNRLLIWNYDPRLIHGYPTPLECPEDQTRQTLRIFYFQSDGEPREEPHRSLYWWDEKTKQPLDNRTQK
jgi:hypothetical protein